MHFKLVLLGFGNVGQALVRLLLKKEDELHSRYGISFSVTGISTGSHGLAVQPSGLDLKAALELKENNETLSTLSISP